MIEIYLYFEIDKERGLLYWGAPEVDLFGEIDLRAVDIRTAVGLATVDFLTEVRQEESTYCMIILLDKEYFVFFQEEIAKRKNKHLIYWLKANKIVVKERKLNYFHKKP